MFKGKDERARMSTANDRRLPGGMPREFVVVTGGRKAASVPAAHSLRDMDVKTVEILVDDKIATGG